MPEIGWFHLGADLESSFPTIGLPEDAAQILERMNSRLSFLMVGTLEPRKGHLQVLGAFEQLWAAGEEINLVIVGKQGWTHLPDASRRVIPKIVNTLPHIRKRENGCSGLRESVTSFLKKYMMYQTALLQPVKPRGSACL